MKDVTVGPQQTTSIILSLTLSYTHTHTLTQTYTLTVRKSLYVHGKTMEKRSNKIEKIHYEKNLKQYTQKMARITLK